MKNIKKIAIFALLTMLLINTTNAAVPFYIGDEKFPIKQSTLLLNSQNTVGNMFLEFSTTLSKIFGWQNNAGAIGGSPSGNFFLNEGLVIYENSAGTEAGTGLTVANAGAGDALLQLLLNGTQRWVVGIDNSDSDKFKIASSVNLASNARLTIDTSGNTGIGTEAPGSKLDILGTLRLSGATSGYVGFSPQAIAGSTTYTLPNTDGSSGDVLSTNGTGTLSWTSPSSGSGDITAVGSMTSGAAFADATADDDWLGLGALAGRIEFDDQIIDEINFLDANIGIKTSTPQAELDIQTSDGSIRIGEAFPNKTASTDNGIAMYNALGGFKSGLFTEIDGALLSYGINISQLGNRDETKMGAILKMDTRAATPYFTIKKQSIGGSIETSDMQIAQSGDIGLGAWPNDSNTFPANLSILARASGIIGLAVRGAIGQTADLQQWQNSATTVLASIESTGLLNVFKIGEALNLGTGTANDVYINFDDGTNRNFGWDNTYSANHPLGTLSTFNNELAFRTLQSSASPIACSSTVAGMQWFDTDTGMLYVCDTSNGRNKWLTPSDIILLGEQTGTCNGGADIGTSNTCAIQWGASLGSDNSTMGIFIAHPITITGYGFSEDNDACTSGSIDIEVWSTGTAVTNQPYTLEQEVAAGLIDQAHNASNLNIDINGNQYINVGMDNNCGQNIDDFNIILYYRYRHI